jgi:hypothetical protein
MRIWWKAETTSTFVSHLASVRFRKVSGIKGSGNDRA